MKFIVIIDNDPGEVPKLAVATRQLFDTLEKAEKYIKARPEIAFRNPQIVVSLFYTVNSLNPRMAGI